jgi:uncharacterized protein YrrD
MLRSTKDLEGYAIRATDGIVGHVKDFYFDDKAWVIRYLVVDTGHWLSQREVLISPISLEQPNWAERVLPVSITKEQVKNSPDVDTQKPVSRQYEMSYFGYYGYPFYWIGPGPWGDEAFPSMLIAGYADPEATRRAVQAEAEDAYARAETEQHRDGDPHLRSCKAVTGYRIEANDGDIGHVQGLLVDERSWAIRHIIVNTSNWWFGHQVLIAPQSIAAVSWPHAAVSVNLTRQAVKEAPPYDPAAQPD